MDSIIQNTASKFDGDHKKVKEFNFKNDKSSNSNKQNITPLSQFHQTSLSKSNSSSSIGKEVSKKTMSDQKGDCAKSTSVKFEKSGITSLQKSSDKNLCSSRTNSSHKIVNKPCDYKLQVDPQKSKKFELSKEAQILMDKLNIPLIESYENLVEMKLAEDNNEEEKGAFIEEEFDQSRPMTTRIYDNEDDQYKNMLSPAFKNNNKHVSVEAGLEGDIREDKEDNFEDKLRYFTETLKELGLDIKNSDISDLGSVIVLSSEYFNGEFFFSADSHLFPRRFQRSFLGPRNHKTSRTNENSTKSSISLSKSRKRFVNSVI